MINGSLIPAKVSLTYWIGAHKSSKLHRNLRIFFSKYQNPFFFLKDFDNKKNNKWFVDLVKTGDNELYFRMVEKC